MTRRNSGEGFERWEFWWEHNKDPFLAENAARASSTPPDAEVVATLLAALDDPNPDLADSAALALARATRGGDADGSVRAALTKTLHHPGKTAREAATLALGVLGRPESIPLLRELLGDTDAGRALTNRSDAVESMVRAFAAASLGMLRAAEAAPDLKAVVQSPDIVDASLKQMALLALGMVPVGVGERSDERVAFLLDRMVERSSNNLVSAQAPIALCRLSKIDGAHAAAVHAVLATRLLPALRDDRTSDDLRRSLAIAVGRIATIEDDDALLILVETIQRAKDDPTRHFAIQALAEIGARDREPERHTAAHALLKARLYEELAGSTHITHQPHAALALGVYFRNERLPAEARAGCVRRLAEVFDATTNPSYQGAIAVALGLLDAKGEADRLWKRFGESNDASLHGYIAVALGLMGARDHARELRDEMRGGVRDAKFRIELAYGVGLQGDPADTKALIACMQAGETIAEAGAAARALGLARDPAARAPLLAIARDAARPPLQRAFAEVALGLLLSQDPLPWPAEFSVDSNYRAKTAALSEILDML
jgi:HEAT repeat protein